MRIVPSLTVVACLFPLLGCVEPDVQDPVSEAASGGGATPAFDAADIPFSDSAIREYVAAELRQAPHYYDIVAFAPGGPGAAWYIKERDEGWTADDYRRAVLQACQHRAGRPCIVYAERGEVVFSDDATPEPVDLQYGGSFDPARVPFVRAEMRATGFAIDGEPYADEETFRALAISRSGDVGWGWGYPTQQEANEGALWFCRRDGGARCFLYAEGDRVVFSPRTSIED